MRIVAFILTIVISTALLLGGIVLLVVAAPRNAGPGWFVAVSIAMSLLVFGPFVIGTFRAYWDVAGSAEARAYYRRLFLIVIAVEVVSAIVTVAFAVATGTSALVPVVFVGAAAILTVVAVFLGAALYRYDVAHSPAAPNWIAIEPAQIRRRVIAIPLTFVGVLILGVIGLVLVENGSGNSLKFGAGLALALALACYCAGFVSIFSTLKWNRRLREVTGRDPSRLRRVSKVVLRKKDIDLDEADRVAAARYAAVISVTLSFQSVYIVFLYAAIAVQQVMNLSHSNGFGGFAIGLVVFLVLALAVLLPLQIVRIGRARRYAAAHADLLEGQPA